MLSLVCHTRPGSRNSDPYKASVFNDFRPPKLLLTIQEKSADIMTQHLSTDPRERSSSLLLACLLPSLAAFATIGASKSAASPRPQVKALAVGAMHHGTAKLRDPRRNVVASPAYIDLCAVHGPNSKVCLTRSLEAINQARAAERVRPMVLPVNYAHMSIARQTFVVSNLERVDRGLRPIVGLTAKLNANARHAAAGRTDPTLISAVLALLGVREYGSIWAGDFGPLASDFDWMYNDGYSPEGSVNLDCRTPGSAGCWGHRHVILDTYSGLRTLISGVRHDRRGRLLARPDLRRAVAAASVSYVYTWKQALASGRGGRPPGHDGVTRNAHGATPL